MCRSAIVSDFLTPPPSRWLRTRCLCSTPRRGGGGAAAASGRRWRKHRKADSDDEFEADFEDFEAEFENFEGESSEDDLDSEEMDSIDVKVLGSRKSASSLGCPYVISSSNRSEASRTRSTQSTSSVNPHHSSQMCYCGVAVALRTTIMSAPNFGRRFITCPKMLENEHCGMFEWIDPELTHNMMEVGTRVACVISKMISNIRSTRRRLLMLRQRRGKQRSS